MTRWSRAERLALGAWLLLAAVLGNGLYDILVSRGMLEYVAQQALHQEGRGEAAALSDAMRETVRYAALAGASWAAAILLAAVGTIHALRRPRGRPGPT